MTARDIPHHGSRVGRRVRELTKDKKNAAFDAYGTEGGVDLGQRWVQVTAPDNLGVREL